MFELKASTLKIQNGIHATMTLYGHDKTSSHWRIVCPYTQPDLIFGAGSQHEQQNYLAFVNICLKWALQSRQLSSASSQMLLAFEQLLRAQCCGLRNRLSLTSGVVPSTVADVTICHGQ